MIRPLGVMSMHVDACHVSLQIIHPNLLGLIEVVQKALACQ